MVAGGLDLAAMQAQIARSLAQVKALGGGGAAAAPANPAAAPPATVVVPPAANNPYLAHRGAGANEKKDAPPVDDTLVARKSRAAREAKALAWVDKGTMVKRGDEMRSREAREAILAAHLGSRTRNKPTLHTESGAAIPGGTAANPNLINVDGGLAGLGLLVPHRTYDLPTPDLEWWDAAFLPAERRKQRAETEAQAARRGGLAAAMQHVLNTPALVATHGDLSVKHQKAHQFVEHPVPVKPVVDKDAPVAMPMMLTAKERKRIRRQRRKERIDDLRDKQRAGLIPPPEPKVRLANLMRVLGNEAILDPTQVEARVRAQAAERLRDHEMRNTARQLTPAERKAKIKAQMLKGTDEGVHVAVFRVRSLTPQQRFKVDINAQENHLTGTVVLCDAAAVNLVLVEGGFRPIKRYIRLMTVRINWAQRPDDGEEEEEEVEVDEEEEAAHAKNTCEMVWTGLVARRSFPSFRFEEAVNAAAARRFMHSKGLAQYWDMVMASANADLAAAIGGGDAAAGIDLEALVKGAPADDAMGGGE